jgi:hypothetical protein
LLILSLLLPGAGRAQSFTPTPTPSFTPDTVHLCCVEEALIGSHGSGSAQLNEPAGLCVSGVTVYVADAGNARIQRFLTNGTPVSPPLTGSAPATLVRPFDVRPGAAGELYVTDQGVSPRAVYRVEPGNTISATVFTSPYAIHGVDVDSDGDVYVTYQNAAPPDSVSKFRETAPGLFSQVAVVTAFWEANDVLVVGNGGEFYVADSRNDRVLRYVETSPGSDSYVQAATIVRPCPGDAAPGCVLWPFQLARSGGLFYVTDIGLRTQVFDASWRWLYQCAPPAPLSYNTIGVDADASQRVYTAIRGGASGDVVRKVAPCALLPSPSTPTPTPPAIPTSIPYGCDDSSLPFYAFPNPVRGSTLNLYYEACYGGGAEFQVFNTASDLVLKQTLPGKPGSNRFSIDARRLGTGVYYGQIELPNAVGGRGNAKVTRFAVAR